MIPEFEFIDVASRKNLIRSVIPITLHLRLMKRA